MRIIVATLFLAAVVVAAPSHGSFQPIFTSYHEEIGIPKATRIKATEEAIDFDGSRIAGGSPSPLGQFPYMAGLVINLTNGQISVCGASLLSHTRLITAAHCWKHGVYQATSFEVVLGSIYLFSGGTRISTSEVEVSSEYDEASLRNDVAMINISFVSFGDNIGPIRLPVGNDNYIGIIATAAGFGLKGDSAGMPANQYLSHVSVPVIANDQCQAVYGPVIVTSSNLCTSGVNGRGICSSDSGGPLQIAGPTLIGVSSFSSALGCEKGYPSGFSRVTAFITWITSRL